MAGTFLGPNMREGVALTAVMDAGRLWLECIDQTLLPHAHEVIRLGHVSQVVEAIASMVVRGAGTIGGAAAVGAAQVWLAHPEDAETRDLLLEALLQSRPTAVDLAHAVESVSAELSQGEVTLEAAHAAAMRVIERISAEGEALGRHGVDWLASRGVFERASAEQRPVMLLTHCNAGWLALIEHGSALAPIYELQRRDIPVHVFVDATWPRGQGARLTAWELAAAGIDHTIIPDGAAASLLAGGSVDAVLVGADRIARSGDVANKLGTFPLALAAMATEVPFAVLAPHSTWDADCASGADIPIEIRSPREVSHPRTAGGEHAFANPESRVWNPSFDITPADLITATISPDGIKKRS